MYGLPLRSGNLPIAMLLSSARVPDPEPLLAEALLHARASLRPKKPLPHRAHIVADDYDVLAVWHHRRPNHAGWPHRCPGTLANGDKMSWAAKKHGQEAAREAAMAAFTKSCGRPRPAMGKAAAARQPGRPSRIGVPRGFPAVGSPLSRRLKNRF